MHRQKSPSISRIFLFLDDPGSMLITIKLNRPTDNKKGQRNLTCYAENLSHAESQPPFLDCWPEISGGGGYEPRPIQMQITKITP
jgi:hypothetical protein